MQPPLWPHPTLTADAYTKVSAFPADYFLKRFIKIYSIYSLAKRQLSITAPPFSGTWFSKH